MKWGHTFSWRICLKVDVIAQIEFEIAYTDDAVQYLSHYATGISNN